MNLIRVVSGLLGAAVLLAQHAIAQPCAPMWASPAFTSNAPGSVKTIAFFDDGVTGPTFYIAGDFDSTPGGSVRRLLPSGAWEPVGLLPATLTTLEVIDLGSGPQLFAGGYSINGLMRWTGTAWQQFQPSPGWSVQAIAAYDDGTGPTLHALVGNAPAQLRKLNGTTWQTLASIDGQYLGQHLIERMLVLDDDGAGPSPAGLFIAGSFRTGTALGQPATVGNGVLRWNGTGFSALLPAPSSWIKAAEVFDDGTGPKLHISFHSSALVPNTVARWDGTTWAPVGPPPTSGTGTPYAFGALPVGGSAKRLIGVGSTNIGLTPQRSLVAGWDGRAWSSPPSSPASFHEGTPFHYGSAVGTLGAARIPAFLFADSGSLARVGAILGCPRCPADTDLDGAATTVDIFLFLDAWFARHPSADLDPTFGGRPIVDLFAFLSAWFAGC